MRVLAVLAHSLAQSHTLTREDSLRSRVPPASELLPIPDPGSPAQPSALMHVNEARVRFDL